MKERPRVTAADPAFVEAIARTLKNYRDGGNPQGAMLSDTELAGRLGVSKSALSKYLHGKQIVGGHTLGRLLTDLGLTILYRDRQISAAGLTDQEPQLASPAEQISFAFDSPCRLEETATGAAVTIQKKDVQSSGIRVQISLAG